MSFKVSGQLPIEIQKRIKQILLDDRLYSILFGYNLANLQLSESTDTTSITSIIKALFANSSELSDPVVGDMLDQLLANLIYPHVEPNQQLSVSTSRANLIDGNIDTASILDNTNATDLINNPLDYRKQFEKQRFINWRITNFEQYYKHTNHVYRTFKPYQQLIDSLFEFLHEASVNTTDIDLPDFFDNLVGKTAITFSLFPLDLLTVIPEPYAGFPSRFAILNQLWYLPTVSQLKLLPDSLTIKPQLLTIEWFANLIRKSFYTHNFDPKISSFSIVVGDYNGSDVPEIASDFELSNPISVSTLKLNTSLFDSALTDSVKQQLQPAVMADVSDWLDDEMLAESISADKLLLRFISSYNKKLELFSQDIKLNLSDVIAAIYDSTISEYVTEYVNDLSLLYGLDSSTSYTIQNITDQLLDHNFIRLAYRTFQTEKLRALFGIAPSDKALNQRLYSDTSFIKFLHVPITVYPRTAQAVSQQLRTDYENTFVAAFNLQTTKHKQIYLRDGNLAATIYIHHTYWIVSRCDPIYSALVENRERVKRLLTDFVSYLNNITPVIKSLDVFSLIELLALYTEGQIDDEEVEDMLAKYIDFSSPLVDTDYFNMLSTYEKIVTVLTLLNHTIVLTNPLPLAIQLAQDCSVTVYIRFAEVEFSDGTVIIAPQHLHYLLSDLKLSRN